MADEPQTVQALIARYHQALSEGNFAAAQACFEGACFRVAGKQSADPTQWAAIGFFDQAELGQWESLPAGAYCNDLTFLHTDVRNNLGLVVTRETGQVEGGSAWEDKVNVWFTIRSEDDWKILGSVHRDDELWTVMLT